CWPSSSAVGAQRTAPVIGSINMPTGALSRLQTTGSPSGSLAAALYWYWWPRVAAGGGVEVIAGGGFTGWEMTLAAKVCAGAARPRASVTVTLTAFGPNSAAVGVQ